MIDSRKLDFWMEKNLNVLMRGKRGVGKSTSIIEAAERNNLKWMYFSAATMDPFTDFVGTPYKAIDPVTGKSYIDFIRPKRIEDDDVEFMFFDEFNRAKPKIRNAVMELIQFKSINGRKFKNLRMIWAAINPEHDEDTDEDYNVERLDPAEADRFHVIFDIETKADLHWFKTNYGESGSTIVQWWNALDAKIKNKISPRRLEYAIQMFNMNGDIRDVLPKEANIGQLLTQLHDGSYQDRLALLMKNDDHEENKRAFMNENFYKGTESIILNNETFLRYFSDFYSDEKWISLLSKHDSFRAAICNDEDKIRKHKEKLQQLVDSQKGKRDMIIEIKKALEKLPLAEQPGKDPIETYFNAIGDNDTFSTSKNREEATAILKGCDFSNMGWERLVKAFAINCYIGGKTNGGFWVDTDQLFKLMNDKAIADGKSFKDLYEAFKAISSITKYFNVNGIDDRIEKRFKQLGYEY